MKRPRLVATVAVLATGLLAVAATRPAQDMPGMPTPLPQHQHILKSVGEWEGTLTSWMMPGAPPTTVPTKEKVEAIGGFWIQSTFSCDFGGMPYLGTGCMGYDTTKNKMVGTWIDNMSSFLAVMEGDMDMAAGKYVMHYKAPDPMTGAMTAHRIETVSAGDSYASTFYMGDGEGRKTMVIEMKRKGGAAGSR